jgi:non-homologous end joining protein Ku
MPSNPLAGTEEPVSKEDITRGYEAGRREYIEVADEEQSAPRLRLENIQAILQQSWRTS